MKLWIIIVMIFMLSTQVLSAREVYTQEIVNLTSITCVGQYNVKITPTGSPRLNGEGYTVYDFTKKCDYLKDDIWSCDCQKITNTVAFKYDKKAVTSFSALISYDIPDVANASKLFNRISNINFVTLVRPPEPMKFGNDDIKTAILIIILVLAVLGGIGYIIYYFGSKFMKSIKDDGDSVEQKDPKKELDEYIRRV
jgi:hypothetical protein